MTVGVLAQLGLILAVGIFSAALTGLLRRYALARGVIDVPNARSSHALPTPRGGGVAIVLGTALALPALWAAEVIAPAQLWALLGAGGVVAVVGFADDHGHIAARWRLLAHFSAAAWALAWLGGLPPVPFLTALQMPGWVGAVFGALYLVWMLNLYNFMDGIDGIAGVEAVCACLGGAALYLLSGHPALSLLPLVLAAAVAGFLCWNFPPAKIFMGDAGSGFLGITLGVLSLQAGGVSPQLFWAWVILLGVFVTDATVTLLRRLLRGEKLYQAHRSHAYQHAARHFGRHRPVTLAVAAINLLWLLPLALGVGSGILGALAGVVLAYAPLALLAFRFRAGAVEKQ